MKIINKNIKNRLTKLFIKIVVISSSILFITIAQANDAQMKETLIRIINQLQSIKPLITQAKQQQPDNPRIKVHFDRFIGADGKWQNGLRQDIDVIQQALINIVNQESIEPRSYQPINNDFIEQ